MEERLEKIFCSSFPVQEMEPSHEEKKQGNVENAHLQLCFILTFQNRQQISLLLISFCFHLCLFSRPSFDRICRKCLPITSGSHFLLCPCKPLLLAGEVFKMVSRKRQCPIEDLRCFNDGNSYLENPTWLNRQWVERPICYIGRIGGLEEQPVVLLWQVYS